MAKTFNDFIIECAAYPYSQEHLDLMKETAELQLMEQFIENQEYMRENAHIFNENVSIEEGYFSESVDEMSLDVLYEKKEEKKKGIFARIGAIFHKIIKAIKNFFFRKKKKHKDSKEKKDKAKEKLLKIKDPQTLITIARRAQGVAKDFVPMKGKQPETKSVLKQFKKDIPEEAKDWIVAGLSEKSVLADVSKFASETIGPLSVVNINTAMEAVASKDPGSISGAMTNLTTTWNNEKTKGMVVDGIDEGSIDKYIDQLQKIESMWAKDIGEIRDTAKSNAEKAYSGAINDVIDKNKDKIDTDIRNSTSKGKKGNKARNRLNKYDDEALDAADKAYETNGGETVAKATELVKYLNTSCGHTVSILLGLDAVQDTVSNAINAVKENGGKMPIETVASDKDGEKKVDEEPEEPEKKDEETK